MTFIYRAPWGTVANERHACAMESGAQKMSPPLKCLGQNTAFCDRHTYLSLVTTISTWAFGQQAYDIHNK